MDTLVIPTNQVLPNSYRTIKGKRMHKEGLIVAGNMTGLIGNKWQLWENLTQITWFSPSGIDSDKVSDIKSALISEIGDMPNSTV